MKTIFRTIAAAALLLSATAASACTSVIISGRATPDGRPLLLKNRDSHGFDNVAVLVQGERYRYVAEVAAGDSLPDMVWFGHNEKGLAIGNTDAYNLNDARPPKDWKGLNDGQIMRRALEICANLKDFETLLDTLPKPSMSNSNFLLIDGQGGAAYYEVGAKGWVKYDVNDPAVAPYGYLVRTNHAMSGDHSKDQGIERFMAATDVMLQAQFGGTLDRDLLLRKLPRHLTHGLTRQNLYDLEPQTWNDQRFVAFRDFIPRFLTVSATVVQGVSKGEDPLLTISWTFVGSTLATPAIPLVITPDGKLPKIVQRRGKETSWITQAGLTLKDILFPVKRGNGRDYIDLSKLINRQSTGILQQTVEIEDQLLQRADSVIAGERSKGRWTKAISQYYDWLDSFVPQQYAQRFQGVAF